MKKILILLLTVVFLFSCNNSSKVATTTYYVVTADRTLVRKAPDRISEVLAVLNRGDKVLVTNENSTDNFSEILYNGKKCYIDKYYIRNENESKNSERNYINNTTTTTTTTNSTYDEHIENADSETVEESIKEEVVLTAENYPKVDGSTANMPLMAMIRSDVLGEELTTAQNKTEVSTTDYAWRSLLDGTADLLLVYEASSETKEIINESNTKLKITPIGVDALVFIENDQNKVDNLTTEQIQDIYTGKIENWKELGGDDKNIQAFQRPLNSGSQTLFLNLVMKGKTPKKALKYEEPAEMSSLIDVLASYNNTQNAIGYSVFYYAKKMYQVPGLKLISVDGVMPSDESIGNGKYPFLNKYYLVIREDTPENSPTKKLYDYILSDKGRDAIIKAGYIPYVEK